MTKYYVSGCSLHWETLEIIQLRLFYSADSELSAGCDDSQEGDPSAHAQSLLSALPGHPQLQHTHIHTHMDVQPVSLMYQRKCAVSAHRWKSLTGCWINVYDTWCSLHRCPTFSGGGFCSVVSLSRCIVTPKCHMLTKLELHFIHSR